MANPTIGQPSSGELVNTAGTLGADLRCYAAFYPSEILPRDLVGNTLPKPTDGGSATCCGLLPTEVDGVTVESAAQKVMRFSVGSRGLNFIGRGWTSSTAPTNVTFFAVLKIRQVGRPAGAATIPLITNHLGSWASGLAIQISTTGTIALGFLRTGTTFHSSTITLTADTWYAVSVTAAYNSTARTWNVYNYDSQTLVADSTTTTDSAFTYTTSEVDIVVNNGCASSNYTGAVVDLGPCGASAITWASGTNGYFAAFYADPWAPARGSAYSSSSGTLTAGDAKLAETSESITVVATRPTNGTTPYTYQWYRSTTPDFTPGAGNILSGKTSLVCTDATAVADTVYFYKCVQTDSAGSPASVTTAVVPAVLAKSHERHLFIGDSLMDTQSPKYFARSGRAKRHLVSWQNLGIGSSSAYTATTSLSWQPSTTQDPVHGQASVILLPNAEAWHNLEPFDYVHVQLGTNDIGASRSAADFKTYLGYIITCVLAWTTPPKVILHKMPYRGDTEAAAALVAAYHTKLDELAAADPTHVYVDDDRNYMWTCSDRGAQTETSPILVHFQSDQYNQQGVNWWDWFEDNILDPLPTPSSGGSGGSASAAALGLLI